MNKSSLKQFIKTILTTRLVLHLFLFSLLIFSIGWLSRSYLVNRQTLRQESDGLADNQQTSDLRDQIQGNLQSLRVGYVVSAGDSLWRLANEFYGDGALYTKIQLANNLGPSGYIEIGQELVIPDLLGPDSRVAAAGTDGLVDQETSLDDYVVQEGDSLWFIALKYRGDGTQWTEIYSLNKEVVGSNPNLIYPNTKLMLPS